MVQRLNLSVELGNKPKGRDGISTDSQQLKFILLGCFSADRHSTDAAANPAQPSLYKVDLDNFDRLLKQIQPCLKNIQLSGLQESLQLSFTSLDDFHPDQLHQQLPQQQNPPSVDDLETPSTSDHQESDQQTLSRLLGEGSITAPSTHTGGSQANRTLVESVVGHLISGSLKQQATENNDQKLDQSRAHTSQLKELIHQLDFQSLESNWRGLDWLLRSLESDGLNEVFIFDLPRDQWRLFNQADVDYTQSDYFQSLVDRFSDTEPSEQKFILICDKYFNSSSEDIQQLERLSGLANSLGSQLITATTDEFLSSLESDPETMDKWSAFYQRGIRANTSLVLPRVLLRLPYGEQYDPVESFQFEELETEWSSDELLWGNPGFALAIQLAADNLSDQQQDAAALADCPSFAYLKERESHLQPCTKQLFTDQQLETLIELGLIPIVGSRHNNLLRIPWYRGL
jgi:type VI secretion system protein ImpC